ncbi:MAG: flagellin [Candidatus Margulisbacteria bacterium]|nr:flagellin [Candidatus Margulisiibacteriota bacterium]
MKINNNIAALNAWRNLGISEAGMSSSLEKLSSGYRINRGADDPAGLLISEKLRSQITGLNQAISNANDAVSMVQTAEGALTEMNTMLNSIRGLAVHAANTSANDASSIAADQTAVNKAVESIQRIATTTKFAGKLLLNGSATNATITGKTGTLASGSEGITVAIANDRELTLAGVTALLGNDKSGDVSVIVTSAATAALASSTVSVAPAGLFISGLATLTLANLSGASIAIAIASSTNMTMVDLASAINVAQATTGITASLVGLGGYLKLTTAAGDYGFTITTEGTAAVAASLVAALGLGVANATTTAVIGSNIVGELKYGTNVVSLVGRATNASGLSSFTSVQSGWTGLTLTLDAARAANTNVAQQATFLLDKNGEKLKFSLTPDASSADIITYGISNLQIGKLGVTSADGVYNATGTYSGLEAITTNGRYNLTDDAEKAVAIIDQAVSDVSSERSRLGSFQKFTLESTINNLGVTRENLTASESRIRDVDMAQEMMSFTKNQILVQAGTAMLAQANQVPSSVLQLLQG